MSLTLQDLGRTKGTLELQQEPSETSQQLNTRRGEPSHDHNNHLYAA